MASPRSKPAPRSSWVCSDYLCFLIDTWGSLRDVKFWLAFASMYSWGRNTDLSVTSIAEWNPVLRAPLSPQDFDMFTPWLAYCLLPYATYHQRITWLLMPFGQSQGHHLHLDDWPTILLDPPLVLLCPGSPWLTLRSLHELELKSPRNKNLW